MRIWCTIFIFVCLVAVVTLNDGSGDQAAPKKKSRMGTWFKNLKDGKMPWKKRADRGFTRGRGANLVMSQGDTIVSSLKANTRFLKPPYQWMYAIDANHVVAFFPGFIHSFTKLRNGKAKTRIFSIRESYKNIKLMNRKKKAGHIGVVGSLVAVLIERSEVELPYNLIKCNGKHFTEYLSMGRADKGSYLSLQYNKLSPRCPLWAELNQSMTETIYRTGKFTLKSKTNKEYHLALPGVNSLPDGKLAFTLWPSYIKKMNLYDTFPHL